MEDNLPKPGDGTPSPQQSYQPPSYPNPPQTSPSYPPNLSNPPQNPDPISEIHSEVAQHQKRDAHGRFIPEHEQNSPNSPNTPNIPNPPNSNPSIPSTPPVPQVIHNTSTKSSDDEPLFEAKVNNPFSSFFNWIKRLIKNEGINIKIKPLTAIGIALAISGGSGLVGSYIFPHSSPILHREVVYQGTIQKTDKGIFLTLPNSDLYTLKPKPQTNIDFQNLQDGPALVKGNLTRENFVIEVSEIIPLGTSQSESQKTLAPRSLSEVGPTTSPNPPNNPNLPNLYPNLTWEVTQSKTLLFTSGKRRIEQEGVYLESTELKDYPQDFLEYYTQALQSSGFKQTLNSSNPNGVTITYAKDELFLTFGVKNVYSGSGDKKQLVGYRAYIEHN